MTDDLVILSGARTAMAEYVGTPGYGKLAGFSALELGGFVADAFGAAEIHRESFVVRVLQGGEHSAHHIAAVDWLLQGRAPGGLLMALASMPPMVK